MFNNYYIKLFIVDIFKYLIEFKVYLCCYFFKQQAFVIQIVKKNTGLEEINKNVNQITRHFLLLKYAN